jgi:chromosomal replication initiator protein
MQTKWDQIRENLRKTMNPGLFQVWIKPLQAELVNDEFKLIAPNDFVANWVRDRLNDEIREAAAGVLGFKPRITVSALQCDPGAALQTTVGGNAEGSLRASAPPQTRQLFLPASVREAAPRFSWQFSFDDFVVGPSNELAFAAARSLCRDSMPSDLLFVCSDAGLGKTHLLQAMGGRLTDLSNRNNARVAYLTAEEFARQMIFALRAKEIERFKARFRDEVDILLLEDVHFFQGKEKIQDELLATLKALQTKGAKVVLSSSFLPRELKAVDSHLASRFCSGFLACIDRPDRDTRRRILQKKASSLQAELPEDVTELLADRIRTDIRQLESCLQNLILKAKLLNRQLSLDLAWQVLAHYATANPNVDINHIVEFVCRSFELTTKQLGSKSRQRNIVLARNTIFFLARKHTDLSLKDIGDRFNRKHSTVLKGITNVEREITLETPLGRQLANTMDRMLSAPLDAPAQS